MNPTLIGAWASILAIVLPFLIAAARTVAVRLESELPANLHATIQGIAQTVVQGIEQSRQQTSGPQKKADAMAAIQTILQSMHLKVPDSFIDLAIEAAVAELPKLVPTASA